MTIARKAAQQRAMIAAMQADRQARTECPDSEGQQGSAASRVTSRQLTPRQRLGRLLRRPE